MSPNAPTPKPAVATPHSLPWWIYLIVTGGGTLMIVGAALAQFDPDVLTGKGVPVDAAARLFAGYLVSRNLVIGAMLIGALFMRNRRILRTLLLLSGLVQVVDVAVDAAGGRWMVVPGVAVLAVLFLFSAARLTGPNE